MEGKQHYTGIGFYRRRANVVLVELAIQLFQVIINYGGPDRSIRMEAFQTGNIRPRRYRNRQVGCFLKELKLTEGKATGIPTIGNELLNNGSPELHYDTDEDRSFFEVELFIYPGFKAKKPTLLGKDQVFATIQPRPF